MKNSRTPPGLSPGESLAAETIFAGHCTEDFDPASLPGLDYAAFGRLSHTRQSVLSWYPGLDKSTTLLEWGGGMGELTGLYCRRCRRVVCYEENAFYADVIKSRHQQKTNLTVVSAPPTGQTFDVVVVFAPRRPAPQQIALWRSLLTSHGRLLVVAENRLAPPYWCGGKSPAAQLPFEDAAGQTGLLSRAQWLQLLAQGGFGPEVIQCFYPDPDAYFPQEIYTDVCLPTPEGNSRPQLPNASTAGYLANDAPLAAEIARNGVYPVFAGAFLWECRNNPADAPCPVEYAAVTENRAPQNRFATLVLPHAVVKKALHPAGAKGLDAIAAHHKALRQQGIPCVEGLRVEDRLEMPRIQHPTLLQLWHRQGREGCFEEESFLKQMDRLVQVIFQSTELLPPGSAEYGEEYGPVLRQGYLELVPANCFVGPTGEFLFFDQEFCRPMLPASIVVSRAIANALEVPAVRPLEPLLKQKYGLSELWPQLRAIHFQMLDEIFNIHISAPFIHDAGATAKLYEETLWQNRMLANGPYLKDILAKHSWQKVGVYGYGRLGQALCRALAAAQVPVAFAIDKRARQLSSTGPPLYTPDALNLPAADVLLVAMKDRQETLRVLQLFREKGEIPAFSIHTL